MKQKRCVRIIITLLFVFIVNTFSCYFPIYANSNYIKSIDSNASKYATIGTEIVWTAEVSNPFVQYSWEVLLNDEIVYQDYGIDTSDSITYTPTETGTKRWETSCCFRLNFCF